MFSKTPQSLLLTTLCLFLSAPTVAETTREWGERALNIQASIDNDAPLTDTTWAGTHNSYANNADDNYMNLALNQSMSVKDQLRSGIRQMVYDVHYRSGAVRVCHDNSSLGWCVDRFTGNRKLSNALDDLVEWINEGNQDQVILLKVEMMNTAENNINKVHKKLDNIESYYYKPSSLNDSVYPDLNSKGCKALPANLSKADVLAAGKNIILYTDKCYSNTTYSSFVFSQENLIDDVTSDSEAASSNAGMTRTKDGATKGNNGSVKLKPSSVPGFMAAGLNIFETYGFGATGSSWKSEGEYPVAPQDLVWSWAEGWPQASAANNSVAMLSTAEYPNRIYHRGNGNTRRAACRDNNGNWMITTSLYNFAGASQGCLTESGGSHKFAMPRNAKELQSLITYRDQNGFGNYSDIYLNYSKASGKWVADIGE